MIDFGIEESVKNAPNKIDLGQNNTNANEKTKRGETNINDNGDSENVTGEVLYHDDESAVHRSDGSVRRAENTSDMTATAENMTEETLYSADVPVRDCQATTASISEHHPWLRYENGELFVDISIRLFVADAKVIEGLCTGNDMTMGHRYMDFRPYVPLDRNREPFVPSFEQTHSIMKSICFKSNQNSWIGDIIEDAAMLAADKELFDNSDFLTSVCEAIEEAQ